MKQNKQPSLKDGNSCDFQYLHHEYSQKKKVHENFCRFDNNKVASKQIATSTCHLYNYYSFKGINIMDSKKEKKFFVLPYVLGHPAFGFQSSWKCQEKQPTESAKQGS